MNFTTGVLASVGYELFEWTANGSVAAIREEEFGLCQAFGGFGLGAARRASWLRQGKL